MASAISPLAAAATPAQPPVAAIQGPVKRHLHGLAVLLLAGAVAALLVLADRLIDTWTDGHLFLAWVGVWLVIFAATALLDSWSRCRASARSSAQCHRPAPAPTDADLQTPVAARRTEDRDSCQHGSFLPYL
jgi:hypothetical protein